jgi:hypothetical protein
MPSAAASKTWAISRAVASASSIAGPRATKAACRYSPPS